METKLALIPRGLVQKVVTCGMDAEMQGMRIAKKEKCIILLCMELKMHYITNKMET